MSEEDTQEEERPEAVDIAFVDSVVPAQQWVNKEGWLYEVEAILETPTEDGDIRIKLLKTDQSENVGKSYDFRTKALLKGKSEGRWKLTKDPRVKHCVSCDTLRFHDDGDYICRECRGGM